MLRAIGDNPDLQLSFVHEYVHFLQLVTSVPAVRLLADLVDFGVKSALILSGNAALGDCISGYRQILPLLRGLRDSAWQDNSDIAHRRATTMDELNVLFSPRAVPYTGRLDSGALDEQQISHGTFSKPLWGYVLSGSGGPMFQPFSVGFLAEAAARKLDRWFASTAQSGHEWDSSEVEAQYYNGLHSILSGYEYAHLDASWLESLTVVVSTLALATPSPDEATRDMLSLLREQPYAEITVPETATRLRDALARTGLLQAQHYSEPILAVQQEIASIMDRAEHLLLHGRLVQISNAANRLLSDPSLFVLPNLTWATIETWMREFPPPPVSMTDGDADQVGSVNCCSFATEFLSEVERTLLREPG
jgi:hypothetical protein